YLVPELVIFLPKIVNEMGQTFIYFIFGGGMVRFIGRGQIFRSSSIFWEPGAFSIYICLALYFELFVIKNKSLKRIIVLILSLITTFSTTGYIVFMFMIVIFLFKKQKFNYINHLRFLTLLIVIL